MSIIEIEIDLEKMKIEPFFGGNDDRP